MRRIEGWAIFIMLVGVFGGIILFMPNATTQTAIIPIPEEHQTEAFLWLLVVTLSLTITVLIRGMHGLMKTLAGSRLGEYRSHHRNFNELVEILLRRNDDGWSRSVVWTIMKSEGALEILKARAPDIMKKMRGRKRWHLSDEIDDLQRVMLPDTEARVQEMFRQVSEALMDELKVEAFKTFVHEQLVPLSHFYDPYYLGQLHSAFLQAFENSGEILTARFLEVMEESAKIDTAQPQVTLTGFIKELRQSLDNMKEIRAELRA